MKTIAILTECLLPIPVTKGGAIETMVEYLVKENEKQHKFHFVVFTRAEAKAMELSKSYKYTEFIFIQSNTTIFNRVLHFFSGKAEHFAIYIPTCLEFVEVLRKLKKMPRQDAYLFEGGSTWLPPIIERVTGKNRLLVHLHWTGKAGRLGHIRFYHRDKSFRYLLPVSDYIGKQWEGMTGRHQNQIKPFYNCVNIERFDRSVSNAQLSALRDKLDIDEEAHVIVFTGRIIPGKGVRELVDAFMQLNDKKAILLIIGSANFGMKTKTQFEQDILKAAEDSHGKIILTGYVPNDELYKYYHLACMAVMPSKLPEACSLVNLEMQAAGLPLIVTKVGGNPEFSNRAAILLENDDHLTENLRRAMETLLADPERRQIMSMEGKKFAKYFSIERYYDRFCSIMDELKTEDNEGR